MIEKWRQYQTKKRTETFMQEAAGLDSIEEYRKQLQEMSLDDLKEEISNNRKIRTVGLTLIGFGTGITILSVTGGVYLSSVLRDVNPDFVAVPSVIGLFGGVMVGGIGEMYRRAGQFHLRLSKQELERKYLS